MASPLDSNDCIDIRTTLYFQWLGSFGADAGEAYGVSIAQCAIQDIEGHSIVERSRQGIKYSDDVYSRASLAQSHEKLT
jgi:hypothetical protein